MGAGIGGDAEKDNSGFSVSTSGDGLTVAIGAPASSFSDSAGYVRIYHTARPQSGNKWVQISKARFQVMSLDSLFRFQ